MERDDASTGLPGEPKAFLPTDWSLLRAAARGDGGARDALYRLYRRPVYHFLRKRAPAQVDTELVADQVMELLFRPGFLAQADPAKGRFRDLLFAMSRHALLNAVRKEKAPVRHPEGGVVSLAELEAEPAATGEERMDFDLLYSKEVLEEAWDRLASGKEVEAEALRLFFFEGLTQPEISSRLGINVGQVNNHIARGKQRLREVLLEVVAPVCRGEADARAEMDYLLDVLSRQGRPRPR